MFNFSRAMLFVALLGLSLMMRASWADTNAQPDRTINFLSLADIHFDPFISCHHNVPCPVIQKLKNANAKEWSTILSEYDKNAPRYRQDTNYPLLVSTLTAAKKIADDTHTQFVLVLGDFLGHEYRQYYIKYSQDRSRESYQAFVRKTFEFMVNELQHTFPEKNVYLVVGNNDSYHADYYSYPRGQFFKDSAYLWSSIIKNKNNRVEMQKTFSTGGYYAINLPQEDNLKLILLNTNFFSYKAKGNGIDKAANDELTWLHNELKLAKDKKQKVILAMHIPVGIDIYASLRIRLFRLIELWNTKYTQRFQAELKEFAPQIVAIFSGHLHSDWSQMLTFDSGNEIPVIGTPSVSPIFGSNPGFKVFTYSLQSQQLINFVTYYFPLNGKSAWHTEYNFGSMQKTGIQKIVMQDYRLCPA